MKFPDSCNLRAYCEFAVPFHIHELAIRGGPTEADRERAKAFGSVLASKGDIFQYGGGKRGEVAGMATECAFGLAVLAFCPRGVTFLETRFDAGMPDITGKLGERYGILPETYLFLDAILEQREAMEGRALQ